MSAQHTYGPWEVDVDSDGKFMICASADTVICRGIGSKADADLICAALNVLPMVLDDIDVCTAECGSDYEFQELSIETVQGLRAFAAIAKAASV